ncbi:MAG: hypothetical protein K9G70_07740 [Prolixibacteraceae bacterium]|nr:hypothetical protein [Prolixibacteraceae bacterium]
MNYFKATALIILITSTLYTTAQPEKEAKVHPYIQLGAGSINDLMKQGKILGGEIGIKNRRGYTFSVNLTFGEMFRDNISYPGIENATFDSNDTYKAINLFLGYEFSSKSGKHLFVPKMGPFLSKELIITAKVHDDALVTYRNGWHDIGFGLGADYHFIMGDYFTIGLSSYFNVSSQVGFLNYVVTPTVGLRF